MRFPQLARSLLLGSVRRRLGSGFDMSHFTPRYMPWDERLCVAPDGDLLRVLRAGKASIVTDHIEAFTPHGILLKSGKELEADIIVTATGLQLQNLGGMEVRVDGTKRDPNGCMMYKAVLLQDIPNFALLFGYTNASWTLKIDLAADYLCRLLKEMERRGAKAVVPRAPASEIQDENILGSLCAGYIQRSKATLPRQGRNPPWRVLHNYEKDRAVTLRQSMIPPWNGPGQRSEQLLCFGRRYDLLCCLLPNHGATTILPWALAVAPYGDAAPRTSSISWCRSCNREGVAKQPMANALAQPHFRRARPDGPPAPDQRLPLPAS